MDLNITILFPWEADSKLEEQQQKTPFRRALGMFLAQQSFF